MAERISKITSRISGELGFPAIYGSSRDTKLLCLQRFVRLFAYGLSTLILVLYLASLGISASSIGLFMTLTLLGDVAISFVLTLFADGLGRRKILVLGAALMSASGIVFAFSGNYWVLVAASVVGVISPSGNEIGPFRAIEESTLAQLSHKDIRSDIFAWYTLIGSIGTALGTIVCGWVVQRLKQIDGWTAIDAYRTMFLVYAALGLVKLILSLLLSSAVEAEPRKPQQVSGSEPLQSEITPLLRDSAPSGVEASKPPPSESIKPAGSRKSIWPDISPSSRMILLKLCLLFAVDSLASGLVPASWITYFFKNKFDLPEGELGTLFFITNLISASSSLVASSISKRVGLVKTMVFTHLPSSVFLALIPVPDNVILAMVFLIVRSCTSMMDVAPRQAFLAQAVAPGERTAVMGVVNVVKTLSQSAGPVVTGGLAQAGKFWVAFLVAGAMKASYDFGMLAMFLGFKGHDEREERGRNEEVPEDTRRERVDRAENGGQEEGIEASMP